MLGLALASALASCGGSGNSSTSMSSSSSSSSSGSASSTSSTSISSVSDASEDDVTATITLNGSSGTISNTAYGSSGSTVTISSPGVYSVTGTSTNVNITVDTSLDGTVYLLLDGVMMTNSSMACIFVDSADLTVIQLSGTNSLTSSNSDSVTVGDASVDGVIHARDDLVIQGSGSLTVTSTYLHGIVAKDDLTISGGTLTVKATKKAIDASDSVSLAGATIDLTSGTDAIQIENDSADSYFYMESGSLTIDAEQDGIQVSLADDASTTDFTGYIQISGGTLDITSGGGSSNAVDESTSQKGLKSDGDIGVSNSTITVSSADDAIHCAAACYINSGTLNLSSDDDGIHSDSELYIYDGDVNVTKSYEGLEAYVIQIDGGDIDVVSEDDGINAAGGSDSDSSGDTFTPPSGWGTTETTSTGTLYINGGDIYLNAGGDGLDSNGSLYVTGGTIIVEAASSGDNSAIDYGDSNYVCSITGGTVLALGSSEMAVNFSSGSQCSGLVGLTGNSGTTIRVNDGSNFSYTATKSFLCLVYSSPSMSKGNSYTVTVGNSSATMDFSSSYYYSNVSGNHINQGGTGQPGGW